MNGGWHGDSRVYVIIRSTRGTRLAFSPGAQTRSALGGPSSECRLIIPTTPLGHRQLRGSIDHSTSLPAKSRPDTQRGMDANDSPQRLKRSRAQTTASDVAVDKSSKRRRLNQPLTTSPGTMSSTDIPTANQIPFSPSRQKKTSADTYEVPDSDEERRARQPSGRSSRRPDPSVYDLPDSDDEADGLPEKPRTPLFRTGSIGQVKETNGSRTGEDGNSLKSQKRRTPKQDASSRENGTHDSIEAGVDSSENVRSSGRRRVPTVKAREGQEIQRIRKEASASRSRSASVINGNSVIGSGSHQELPAENVAVPLRGILTPSKRRGDKRRKSVAFGSPEPPNAPKLFFEDLPTQSVKSKKKKKQLQQEHVIVEPAEVKIASPTEQVSDTQEQAKEQGVSRDNADEEKEEGGEEVDEVDEDAPCAICSKRHSRKNNEIVFCDGCDFAVHQKCYGVSEIPQGDWFCKACAQKRLAKAEANARLPNFERHLRSMQRALLDRCTGRRRIKLIGQDEAYSKAQQMLEQTVLAGEGNSMLVIGARGSGKTTACCSEIPTRLCTMLTWMNRWLKASSMSCLWIMGSNSMLCG